EPSGEFTGFLVQEGRDRKKPITIAAARGAFAPGANGSRILLVNGNRQQLDRATGKLSVLTFDKYTLDLADLHDGPEARTREPQERFFSELFFASDAENDPTLHRALLVDANQRLAATLTPLGFSFIALTALLGGEFNRRGQIRRILFAVLLAFLFETLDLASRNLASRNLMFLPLLYLNTLAPVAVG